MRAASVDFFFFQAEDGIRDAQESRGLGDVYKRQAHRQPALREARRGDVERDLRVGARRVADVEQVGPCLLYTSDAADDLLCVDLGGRRLIKKQRASPKTPTHTTTYHTTCSLANPNILSP